jgi:hypothetical protein
LFYERVDGDRVASEIHLYVRDSKTDIGGAGVVQMVKCTGAPHLGDVRELIPRLAGTAPEEYIFPLTADVYRRRMRTVLLRNARGSGLRCDRPG